MRVRTFLSTLVLLALAAILLPIAALALMPESSAPEPQPPTVTSPPATPVALAAPASPNTVLGGEWNDNGSLDLTCANSLNWQVYADAGGMPDGDPRGSGNPPDWSISLPPSDPQVTLSTGTEGDLSYVAQVINPDGGFGFPTTWTSVQDASTWNLSQQDFAFRLIGGLGILGQLDGHVMDSETGDTDPTCTNAVVHVQPGNHNIPVDPTTGYYHLPLAAGTYVISATAPGYSTGGPYLIHITSSLTTTQDFNLWRPVIEVSPTDFISLTAYISHALTVPLFITNAGHLPLTFEITEIPPLLRATPPTISIADLPAPTVPSEQATGDCALLDDPIARGLMSFGLEMKLRVQCGLLPAPKGEDAEPVPAPGPSPHRPLQFDILVNNPLGDSGSYTTQSETSISVNSNTGTICSAYNDSQHWAIGGIAFSGFSSSTDGGMSFVDHGPIPPGGGGNSFGDPSLVWRAADGLFYFASLHSSGLGLWRSTDDCQTFAFQSLIHVGGNDDKEIMVVDNNPASPYYGRLYVAWTDFTNGHIYLTYSDNTTTWSTPVDISGHFNVQGAWPAIDPVTGDVYVAWVHWDTYPNGPIDVEIVHSTDGGATWSFVTNPANNVTNPRDSTATSNCGRPALNADIRYSPFPQIVVGPDHCLHAVYSYDPDIYLVGDVIDVFYRRSCDQGITWDPEVRLNDDATLNDQWFPTISVGDSNILVATWYDRRLDGANYLFDYYKAISPDGGNSWMPNIRVSDVSSAVPVLRPNFDPAVLDCYHGDYDQQVQYGNRVYIQWADDRNFQNGHPDPDVWFEAEPLPSEGLPWVWEVPIGGIIPPTTTLPVSVTFHCTETRDYIGTLRITNNDPCVGPIDVPIQLHCQPLPPPEWGKWINGQAWSPGITITVQTSDTITVTEIITSVEGFVQIEQYYTPTLTLIDYRVGHGVVLTDPVAGVAEWRVLTPTLSTVTLTKWFHVEPCTWTETTLNEILLPSSFPPSHRAITITKLGPALGIGSSYDPAVPPGALVTFTLTYSNAGGYENDVWITNTFPISAPFVGSIPPPTAADPQGLWAEWSIGDLAMGGRGNITVTIAVSDTLLISATFQVWDRILNHVGEPVEAVTSTFYITMRRLYLPLVLKNN